MKLLSGFTLVFILFLCSCKKEGNTEQFVSYDDTTWRALAASFIHPMDTLFAAAYTETLTANVAVDDTVHFSRNVALYCPAGFCASTSGGAISGKVNLSLLYLKSKGDFVRFARPTYSTANGLLDNTAAFKITATQNNQPLMLAAGKYVNIHFNVTNGLHSDNLPLYGDTTASNTGNFNWVTIANQALLQPFTQVNGNSITYGYNMQSVKTGWAACGRIAENNNAPTSKLIIILPPVFTNKTASVYAVARNQRSVIRLTPDITSRTFSTGKIPGGSDVTIIVMAKTNTNYYLEAVNLTVPVSGWQWIKIKPSRSSKQQISDLLDAF